MCLLVLSVNGEPIPRYLLGQRVKEVLYAPSAHDLGDKHVTRARAWRWTRIESNELSQHHLH